MGWRSTPLPADWPRIRKRVMKRDGGICTAILANGTRCHGKATDVHHLGSPNDHSESNLTAVCAWHHKRLTSAQANAKRKRVTQRYPSEKHPGVQ